MAVPTRRTGRKTRELRGQAGTVADFIGSLCFITTMSCLLRLCIHVGARTLRWLGAVTLGFPLSTMWLLRINSDCRLTRSYPYPLSLPSLVTGLHVLPFGAGGWGKVWKTPTCPDLCECWVHRLTATMSVCTALGSKPAFCVLSQHTIERQAQRFYWSMNLLTIYNHSFTSPTPTPQRLTLPESRSLPILE